MEDRSMVTRSGASRWVTLMVLLFVLAVGITIGTLVSTRVDAEKAEAQQIKISDSGKPLTAGSTSQLQQGFADVAALVGPAVVNVNTESIVRNSARSPHRQLNPEDFPGLDLGPLFRMPEVQRVQALGSGFIVDPAGFIITNNHVINGADKIKVNLKDGAEYTARVIGKDEYTDVAVIKIEGTKPFSFLKIGDSSKLRTGDWVIAIGSPFNLAQTVTAGIISATGRVVQDVGIFNDYLQTDAAINRGNSGGPLVNMAGEVVGINTFIQSTSGSSAGVGFAVPSLTFIGIYNQLAKEGKVHRGWLGISMNQGPITPEMAKFFGLPEAKGVLVTDLIDETGGTSRNGPAAKAGILPEDVIVEIGGKQIESDFDLRSAIANASPGSKVRVKAIRKGEMKTFEVALAERSIDTQTRERRVSLDEEKQEEPPKPQEIGLTVDNITPAVARQLQLDSNEGALVIDVKSASLAEEAGLRQNDIITHLNGQPVSSAQSFGQLFRGLKSGQGAVVRFVRTTSRDGRKQVQFTSMIKP